MGPGTEDSVSSAAVPRGPEMHRGNGGKPDRGGGKGVLDEEEVERPGGHARENDQVAGLGQDRYLLTQVPSTGQS